MRLCSIRLNNVRRFTAPVEIADIGPGLNVLSAPNEQGKSTILDALHALFFKDAKSADKEVRSLIPHAGGDPEVSVTIELEGQKFKINKVFSKRTGKGEAKVFKDGLLFKQASEAEEWIADLMKAPKDGGPAGLLWVRQGATSFKDGKETLEARRDLMSSVTGEVEDITGGRQMEAIRAQVSKNLELYVTKTGATKKHGSLWEAEDKVKTLEGRQLDLAMGGFIHHMRWHQKAFQSNPCEYSRTLAFYDNVIWFPPEHLAIADYGSKPQRYI